MSTFFFAKNCGRTQDLNSRNFKEIGSKFPNDHCNIDIYSDFVTCYRMVRMVSTTEREHSTNHLNQRIKTTNNKIIVLAMLLKLNCRLWLANKNSIADYDL